VHLADHWRLIAEWHLHRPLGCVASKIWDMSTIRHEDQGNQCILYSECWVNVGYHVIIIGYLSLPEYSATSPQCAFRYEGISVAYCC
jgi:hypothetical protein